MYKLKKALYGLRQAPRAWYSKLSKSLEDMGLIRCPYEYSVYTKRVGSEVLIVGIASRFMERPTVMHLNAVKRILHYIKGSLNFGLVYSKNSGNNLLTGYSDSDLAGHLDNRKSTRGNGLLPK